MNDLKSFRNNNFFSYVLLERNLFCIVLLTSLIPILSFKFFPTLDGPAHLYNSFLINDILFNSDSVVGNYFFLNTTINPNLTGHVLLSISNYFFPAFIAEKIVLLFYVIGFSVAFRYLVKQISPGNMYVSYLVFPFVYSYVFFLGFYNFSIGMVFLFITLGYWIKNENTIYSIKNVSILFIFILLTYFSHIFVFSVLILSIAIRIFFRLILVANKETIKTSFLLEFEKIKALFLAAFIPLILFGHYFLSRAKSNNESFLSKDELIDDLIRLKAIVGFNSSDEQSFVSVIGTVLATLFAICTGICIYRLCKKKRTDFRQLFSVKNSWLVLSAILLFLYFYLPNFNSYGGFISKRVSLMFYLFLLLFLSTIRLPKIVKVLAVSIVLIYNYNLNNFYTKITGGFNDIAINCTETADHIKENSVVLPLDFSGEWLTSHYSNYLGINKPLIILENYEALNDYFPLKWNRNSITDIYEYMLINNFNEVDNLHALNQPDFTIDYLFILKNLNKVAAEEYENRLSSLEGFYSLVFENENCQLFQLLKDKHK